MRSRYQYNRSGLGLHPWIRLKNKAGLKNKYIPAVRYVFLSPPSGEPRSPKPARLLPRRDRPAMLRTGT